MKFLFTSLIIFLALSSADVAHAQMFSVEDDDPVRIRSVPSNAIYVGLEPAGFDYKGSPQSGDNAGIYQFDGPLLRAAFKTTGLEAYIGVGGRLTGLDEVGYFDAGIKGGRGLVIFSRPRIRFQIPLQLKSSITTVTSDQFLGSGVQFQQGTLSLGAGGSFGLRFSDGIRFSAGIIPNYGFSFAMGGIFGGQIYDLETETRLYLDRIFGESGISIGWDYGFKRFDIEENEFDYNLRTHSLLIGLTF